MFSAERLHKKPRRFIVTNRNDSMNYTQHCVRPVHTAANFPNQGVVVSAAESHKPPRPSDSPPTVRSLQTPDIRERKRGYIKASCTHLDDATHIECGFAYPRMSAGSDSGIHCFIDSQPGFARRGARDAVASKRRTSGCCATQPGSLNTETRIPPKGKLATATHAGYFSKGYAFAKQLQNIPLS
jgi:hypothetical protein